MAKVNAKILALKYKLEKALQKSIEKDKEAIKNGAEITFKDYCKIQVVECTRATYSKEDQAKLDEYAKNNGPFVTNRLRATKDGKHLEIFRKLVRIFEETEKDVPAYDWKSFRYITKNGQVVCAYSYKDYEKLKTLSFARGINDKFDINLNVEKYLAEFGIDA